MSAELAANEFINAATRYEQEAPGLGVDLIIEYETTPRSGQQGEPGMSTSRELTKADFGRAMKASQRRRIMRGQIDCEDIAAIRHFVGLSQAAFASALDISVYTLRNWEQGRRTPDGAALTLLRIAARHPNIVREASEPVA